MLLEKKGKNFYKKILFKLFYKIQALIVNIDIPVDAGIFVNGQEGGT